MTKEQLKDNVKIALKQDAVNYLLKIFEGNLPVADFEQSEIQKVSVNDITEQINNLFNNDTYPVVRQANIIIDKICDYIDALNIKAGLLVDTPSGVGTTQKSINGALTGV
jgi:hypothetical protein